MTKPTSGDTREWILQGMHRVLRYRAVTAGVQVNLAGKAYGWASEKPRGEARIYSWNSGLPGKPTKPPKPLPNRETKRRVLQGLHRALKYRGIEGGVSVQFAGQQYCWRCHTDAGGNTVCGWEPC